MVARVLRALVHQRSDDDRFEIREEVRLKDEEVFDRCLESRVVMRQRATRKIDVLSAAPSFRVSTQASSVGVATISIGP